MYGATWCGPCKMMRAFFAEAKIPYTYVDEPKSLEAYERASMGGRGIPLTVIGSTKIRGFQPDAVLSALGRKSAAAETKSGGKSYGGKAPELWQREFRELRAFIQRLDEDIKQQSRVAVDDVEKADLERKKKRRAIADDSLSLLDADALRYALPRNYRE